MQSSKPPTACKLSHCKCTDLMLPLPLLLLLLLLPCLSGLNVPGGSSS
jgi:hypothetical protein